MHAKDITILNIPRGAMGRRRIVSTMQATRYGRFASSSYVGIRSGPTTRSTSSRAFCRHSGLLSMNIMNDWIVLALVSEPASSTVAAVYVSSLSRIKPSSVIPRPGASSRPRAARCER